jgi:endonuclease YncB( thermonuclease family)
VLCAAQDPACAPDAPGKRVSIEYIIDGDTVILGDGEHVRMVGIDTPELGHHGDPDQPGAAAARDWLRTRLPRGSQALAVADRENRDRHGRLLRHLFLPDDTNLQAALLAEGLAAPLVIPPSLKFLSCYQQAADAALHARAGLWGRPEYLSTDPDTLAPDTRGFRIIRDRVQKVHWTRGGAWLELSGPLSVTIPAADFRAFDRNALAALPGQQVEFRGMVYPYGGRLRLYLRHPLNLIVPASKEEPASTHEQRK